jgi:hypothetical protein
MITAARAMRAARKVVDQRTENAFGPGLGQMNFLMLRHLF